VAKPAPDSKPATSEIQAEQHDDQYADDGFDEYDDDDDFEDYDESQIA
jgi:hypothetical protein